MLDRIKKMASEVGNSALTAIQNTANPELKGVNAMAGTFSALVMADRVCEPEELEMVADFMVDGVDIIQEVRMTREACELFLEYTKNLEAGYAKGPVEGAAVMGELLEMIAEVKNDAKWREAILKVVDQIVADKADESEKRTAATIKKRLAL